MDPATLGYCHARLAKPCLDLRAIRVQVKLNRGCFEGKISQIWRSFSLRRSQTTKTIGAWYFCTCRSLCRTGTGPIRVLARLVLRFGRWRLLQSAMEALVLLFENKPARLGEKSHGILLN